MIDQNAVWCHLIRQNRTWPEKHPLCEGRICFTQPLGKMLIQLSLQTIENKWIPHAHTTLTYRHVHWTKHSKCAPNTDFWTCLFGADSFENLNDIVMNRMGWTTTVA